MEGWLNPALPEAGAREREVDAEEQLCAQGLEGYRDGGERV